MSGTHNEDLPHRRRARHVTRASVRSWLRRTLAGFTSVLLAATGLLFGAVPAAHAATIFSDNFTSGLGGWTNQNWTSDAGTALSVGDVIGNWSSLLRGVDTSDYQNVELSYRYFIAGNVDQSLQVSVRPNAGSAYTVVGDHASDTGGWQTATVSIAAQADLASAFQLQFAVTSRPGSGSAPPGFEVRIDDIVISGDLDTTPPNATLVEPAHLSMVPNSTTVDFRTAITDDYSDSSEIQVRYRFVEAADPANWFLAPSIGWANPTAGEYNQPRTGSSVRSSLGNIPSGSAVDWYAQVRDHSGNEDEIYIGTFYAGQFPVVITSPPPPDGALTVPYSHQITATGTTPISYSLTADSDPLPPGLALTSSTGLIAGTPTAAGTYTFTIETWNGLLPQVTAAYTVVIAAAPEPPIITSGNPPDGAATVPYSHTFTASGTGTPAFTVIDAALLPPGLSLTGDELGGTPSTPGTYTFEIRASNGTLPDDVEEYTVVIANAPIPPTITSGAPVGGEVGQPYSFTVTATGDPTLSFSSAELAAIGLGIDASTGVISGTPISPGSHPVTITVSNGVNPDATENYTLTIDPAPTVAPTITSADPVDGEVGVSYSHTFTATGTGTITFSVSGGTLPPGVTLSGATLGGTPTASGPFTFTILASNGTLPDATETHTITIAPAPVLITVTSSLPAAGTVGTPYAHTITIDGPVTPGFALSAGSLPAGLSLGATSGEISGTPTADGASSFSITITDAGRLPTVVNYSITVDPAAGTGGGGTPGLPDTGASVELGQAQAAAALTLLGLVLVVLARGRVRARRP
ncbi:MAG: putative Ig domain-containing protein [Cryobacterium sp.]|nr:putative Ig domain-containing protein [Cryobacterium sp.]